MIKNQPVKIVLVEDNPGHARLIVKNLKRSRILNEVVVLENGREAVDYLLNENRGNNHGQEQAQLLLLDLNLPELDGYQVLEIIKKDEKTKQIPVIVLTTTDSPREISKCYELGCNVYITKPVDYGRFSEAIRNLGLFLSIVKVPNEE